ncbi:MAG TPA: hypothetical protein VNZ86_16010, partial [Bacteroidia bacterium]|nr:hypothetical protein [Bacteroidia bacterium]
MKNALALLLLLSASIAGSMHAQSIVFEEMFPETNNKPGSSIAQTSDGGYIIGTNYINYALTGKGY